MRLQFGVVVLLLLLAGCTGGATHSSTATLSPTPTQAPDDTRPHNTTSATPADSFQRFTIWAKDDLTLTVQFTESDTNQTVYRKPHSMNAGTDVAITDPFDGQPYRVSLTMSDDLIWQGTLQPCNRMRVSVDADGNVTVTDNGLGDC